MEVGLRRKRRSPDKKHDSSIGKAAKLLVDCCPKHLALNNQKGKVGPSQQVPEQHHAV